MTTTIARFRIADDRDVAQLRQRAKDLAEIAGLPLRDRARFATAVSEVSRDSLARGSGSVDFAVAGSGTEARLEVVIRQDTGSSGLTDHNSRLLLTVRQLCDHFHMEDAEDGTTTVHLGCRLPPGVEATPAEIARWREEVAIKAPFTAVEILRQQNSELAGALAALRDKEIELESKVTEIEALNQQLVERQGEAIDGRRRAEEATRAKATFLANMSHEIRTPMNAVIGFASLLVADETLTGEQLEMVERVRSAGEHLLAIIDDILDLSKIEAGRLDLEEEPFSLQACVEETLGLVASKAAEKSIELAFVTTDDVPEGLVADQGRLRQVLLNLLSNAVKFTLEGEVVVTASARSLPDGAVEVTFAVRDTGIGIAPEHLGHLFEPFRQAKASTTRDYGGTGLGLAICAQLCALMGRGIEVESTPGKGSTFTFTVVAAPAPPGSLPPPVRPADPAAMAGRRVLVVDDNATNRLVLRRALAGWGVETVEAASGAAAVALVDRGEHCDAALVDLEMPGMDGVALAEALSGRLGDRRPPLVLLAPMSLDGGRDALTGGHFAGRVVKPLRHAQLLEVLSSVLAPARPVSPVAHAGPGVPPGDAPRSPLRILLVEDNLVNRKVALGMLSRLGYQADVAVDGVEAVESVRAKDYDLVLMDVQMPRMNGWEATERIRAEVAGGRPRIVALTASVTREERARCTEAGMNDFLGKPYTFKQLAEVVAQTRAAVEPGVS